MAVDTFVVEVVAFAAIVFQVKNNTVEFLDIQMDRREVDKVVGTLLEQKPLSSDIPLDRQELDMVEDTFEVVEPSASSLVELAYIQMGKMVACMVLGTLLEPRPLSLDIL